MENSRKRDFWIVVSTGDYGPGVCELRYFGFNICVIREIRDEEEI